MLDTRRGTGTGGAVVLNLTGVAPTASAYLTAFPHRTARPNASNPNRDVSRLSPGEFGGRVLVPNP